MPPELNPYQAPAGGDDPDDGTAISRPVRPPHRFGSWLAYVVVAGCAGLLLWCALDLLYVRVLPYPAPPGPWERGALLLYLVAAFAGGWGWFRAEPPVIRALLTGTATILAQFLAFLLIGFLGIPFHVWIGGLLF